MPPKEANTKPREWAYQGVECYVSKIAARGHRRVRLVPREPNKRPPRCYVASQPLSGHVPLYRLEHESRNAYCYCTTIDERNARADEGYRLSRPVGYVMTAQEAQHVPLMRMFNPNTSRYYYTTRIWEVDEHAPVIEAKVLEDRLQNLFGMQPKILDREYFCPTKQAAEQIIRHSRVPGKRYSDQAMDCDDYAHLLKAAFIEDAYEIYDIQSALRSRRSKPYALGVICGVSPSDNRHHFMNILVTSEGRLDDYSLSLVEPQTGELLPLPENLGRLTAIALLAF